MINSKFRNSARTNRLIAFCFTFVFHASLVGALYYSSEEDRSMKDLVPESIMEWFDGEAKEEDVVEKDRA